MEKLPARHAQELRRSLHCHPNCSSQNSSEQGAKLVHEQNGESTALQLPSQQHVPELRYEKAQLFPCSRRSSCPCPTAPPHVQGCKGAASQPLATISQAPELEQPKCQARCGQAELQPCGEQAHVLPRGEQSPQPS